MASGASSSTAPVPVKPADLRDTGIPGLFRARPLATPANTTDTDLPIAPVEAIAGFAPYSIRNGSPTEIRPYLSRPSIPNWAKWVVVPGMAAGMAYTCMDAIVRSHIYNVMAHGEGTWSADKKRKTGLILGVMRASMLVNYDIQPQELMAGESIEGPIAYVPAVPASAPGVTPVVAERPARFVVRLPDLPAVPTGASATDPHAEERAYRLYLTSPLEYSQAERDAMASLLQAGQAALPLQGFSLVNDDHHYLTEANKVSFRAFQNVERQLWLPLSVKAFYGADQNHLRDVMWHKAGHPVVVPLKHQLCTSVGIRDNLRAAGLGSAASRLPAIEAEARAGAAFLALCKVVSALWGPYNAYINYDYLDALMSALTQSAIGVAPPAGGFVIHRAGENPGDPDVTETFADRSAILRAIQETVTRCGPQVAIAAGFYKAFLDSMETETRTSDTLLQANSIKNLGRDYTILWWRGVGIHQDYRIFKADKRKDKEFDVFSFTIV